MHLELPERSTMWLNRFAWLTCVATLLLICSGGMVTSKGVGLAVPDWPTKIRGDPNACHCRHDCDLPATRARGNNAPSTPRPGDSRFSHGKRLVDSRYQCDCACKDERVARRPCLLGCDCIPNLAANGAPPSCVHYCHGGDCVLSSRPAGRAIPSCAQTIVDLLGRIGRFPGHARALDHLDQQSGRHRNRACRGRCDHAIFWSEQWRDLMATLGRVAARGAKYQSGSDRSCPTRFRMKTTVIESANLAPPRNRFAADLAELVKARLTLLVLLTTAVGFYLGSESPVNYGALFHVVFGTAAAAAGAAALNQWWERAPDALMRRTKMRA